MSLAFVRVVEARFLRDLATGLDDADVALDLVLQRLLDEAERVDVLDLGFGAEFFLSARPHADVGVAAQRTFFHVAVADAGVEDDFLEPGEVLVSFLRRSHVRFADDLGQGHAGAVQIDRGLGGSVGEALVQTLARVFFQVQAGNADFLLVAVRLTFVRLMFRSISMNPNSANGLSYCEI